MLSSTAVILFSTAITEPPSIPSLCFSLLPLQNHPPSPHCAFLYCHYTFLYCHYTFLYCHYRTTLRPLTVLCSTAVTEPPSVHSLLFSTAITLFSTAITEPPSIHYCTFFYCHYTFLYCHYRTTLHPLLHFFLLPLYLSLLPLQNHPPSPHCAFLYCHYTFLYCHYRTTLAWMEQADMLKTLVSSPSPSPVDEHHRPESEECSHVQHGQQLSLGLGELQPVALGLKCRHH